MGKSVSKAKPIGREPPTDLAIKVQANPNAYWRERERIGLDLVMDLGVGISPVDFTRYVHEADQEVDGDLNKFPAVLTTRFEAYLLARPEKQRMTLTRYFEPPETPVQEEFYMGEASHTLKELYDDPNVLLLDT